MKHSPINNVLADTISGEWGVEPEDESGVKIIRTANFTNLGIIDFANIVLRKIEPKKIQQKKLITGDVIIEKSGGSPTQPVGRVVYFENPDNSTYLCNNFTTVLRPDKSVVFPKFLFYVLFYNHLTKKTLRFQNKTTGIINLKLENYLNSKIPLPPLDDQIRIATILTCAERLIAKRKESIKALDELLKSTFLEMFGDDEQWEAENLSDLSEIVSGVTKGKRYADKELIEIPYMRVANVQDGHLILDEIKTIAVTKEEIDRYLLKTGDILLTEGGDPDKLGRGTIWNNEISKCIHQNHIFRVRVNAERINPIYLSTLIGSVYGKKYFLRAAKQTTGIASINSTQLKKFPVIIPPLPLQNQFAAIVEKVESIKAKQTQSLVELESLYGSLSQRAFKGELDLSRVPVVYVEAEPLETKGTISADVKVTKAFSKDELINILKAKAVR